MRRSRSKNKEEALLQRLASSTSDDGPDHVFVAGLRRQIMELARESGNPLVVTKDHRRYSETGASLWWSPRSVDLFRKTQQPAGTLATLLIVAVIIMGILVTNGPRFSEIPPPSSSSLPAASVGGVDFPVLPGTSNAPGGYQEIPYAYLLLKTSTYEPETIDGLIATMEQWSIAPGTTQVIDTSAYLTEGFAVDFVVEGAWIATFEKRVTVTNIQPHSSGTQVIEPGIPVELVAGEAVSYELGQVITIGNPFRASTAQVQHFVVSDDPLAASDIFQSAGLTIVSVGEERLPEPFTTLRLGIFVTLTAYWNIPGSTIPEVRERTLFTPSPLDDLDERELGFFVSYGEPIG